MLATFAIFLLGLTASASAHLGCSGHDVARRNHGGRHVPRQAPTDEASGASSVDAAFQCTGYSYAPVAALKSSYPTVWQIAQLVQGDTAAASLFATVNETLNAKLPTDTVHCGAGGDCTLGDFDSFNYSAGDPDCWWSSTKCTTPAASTGLVADIVSVPEPMTWGLGFDDGPNCSHNAFYDYLAEQNQKATMFYIGSNVMDWPLQALRGIADGHQICVHTWAHHYMTALTNEQAFAELYYSRKIIKDILGVTPLCWRPPFGDVDNRIRTIAASLNLTTIVWGSDTFDWAANANGTNITAQTVAANYQAVITGAKNGTYNNEGAIVLTHELNNYTMSQATSMLPAIKAAFKYVVPICAAMNQTHPYAETNITCPNFASYISGETNTSVSTSDAPTTSGSTAGNSSTSGNGSTPGNSSTVGTTKAKSDAGTHAPALLGSVVVAISAVVGVLAVF